MKYEFLKIKKYIDGIMLDNSQEYFIYEHFPYIQNVLNIFTAKEQDYFIEELFTWSDYYLYIISEFLNSNNFKLKGKYNSGYVYCECFSKINDVEYLKYLVGDLELQLAFCNNKNELSVSGIVNNLYLVINNMKDVSVIDKYLKMIGNLKNI